MEHTAGSCLDCQCPAEQKNEYLHSPMPLKTCYQWPHIQENLEQDISASAEKMALHVSNLGRLEDAASGSPEGRRGVASFEKNRDALDEVEDCILAGQGGVLPQLPL